MPVDDESSEPNTPSHNSQPMHQDLDFSLNDILSNNHDVNDSSFQSIVQTLSNNSDEQHITPSYAHLPAELQDLFNTNETDDLLSVQGSNADASSILQGDMIWQQQPFAPPPPAQKNPTNTIPIQTNASPVSNTSTPNTVHSPSPFHPAPLPSQPSPSIPVQHNSPSQQQQASPTTLLDNITAQLPPDRKDMFIQLFRELQTNQVSAQQFLSKAKNLLGQQEYQQLENLKNKPAQFKPMEEDNRKRILVQPQIKNEDLQNATVIPQLKRVKTEHIPMLPQQQQQQQPMFPASMPQHQQQQLHQLQMQLQQQHHMQLAQAQAQKTPRQNKTPNKTQPALPPSPSPLQPNTTMSAPPVQMAQPAVFKTPAVPATPTLQVPTKTNLATPSKTASSVNTQPSNIVSAPTPINGNIVTPNTMVTTPATPISNAEIVNPSTSNAATNNNNTSGGSGGGGGGGGGDSRIDYDTLTDVMGYAGVDLKEEAEHFMREEENIANLLPDGVDRSKAQDFMNTDMLRTRVLSYAKHVNIKEIDSDFVSYLALATQDRIRTVLEAMVAASKHRTFDPFRKPPLTEDGHPLFKIQMKQHVTSQLEAIERVERNIELDLDPVEEDESPITEELGWYSNRSKRPLVSKAISSERKVTVKDAIFVMERDVQGGRNTSQRTLLKAYNEWLC